MKKIFQYLAKTGEHVVLHCAAISLVIVGIFMVATASDLGPAAPIFIPLGIYMSLIGICMELLFGIRLAIATSAGYLLKRQNG
jgi:hypothetical protein